MVYFNLHLTLDHEKQGFPGGTSGKELACQCRRRRFDPWVRKIPLEKETATHSSIIAWAAAMKLKDAYCLEGKL